MSRTRPKKDTKPRDSQTDDKSASLFPFLRACLSPSSPFFPILALSIFLKLLLIPSYSSTDFEVHRNWLAITRNLPIEKWYTENTSEWTLDYPPFFAWFEWTLGWVGMRVLELRTGLGIPGDQNLFKISEGPVMSWEILVFQRLTVVITDLVFWTAIVRLVTNTRILATERTLPRQILVAITYLNPGLLMVDHIHFQYNGFLFGILCWSIAMAFEGRELLSAALFAALLNFKHIYLYIAPAYFVWLLRGYCFKPSGSGRERFDLFRLVKLGLVVVSIFALSFGPFIASGVLRRDPSEQPMDAALGSLQAIVSRLFPFKRGLVHAYWAGNFWALYVSLDRFLAFGLKFLGFAVDMAAAQSATRGLVEDVTFAVLPDVRPGPAAGLTLLAQIVGFQRFGGS